MKEKMHTQHSLRVTFYDVISYMLFVAAIVYMAVIFSCAQGDDIWYDEVFSLVFSKRSVKELIYLTSNDVHPPFYYIYLKFMAGFLGIFFRKTSYIVLSKIASMIPWIGIFVLSITYIRKKFSLLTSGIYIFMITVMPQLSGFYIEIRMYSLAMFLITSAFIALLSIVGYKDTTNGNEYEDADNKKLINSFIVFFICGILTAYTQYYACVGIIGLYIILLVYLCHEAKIFHNDTLICDNNESLYAGKKSELRASIMLRVKLYIACIIGSIVLYLPWLPTLYKQMTTVSASYWIQPLTIRSIFGCIKFMYLPVSGDGVINYISAGLMIFVTCVVTILFLFLKPDFKNLLIGMSGYITLGTVIAVGFIFSILKRPIFVYRYMIPAMGVYYLSLAFMASYIVEGILNRECYLSIKNTSEKKDVSTRNYILSSVALVCIIIPVIMTGHHHLNGFYYEEHMKVQHMPETYEALKNIKSNSVVITNFDQVTFLMDYYLPKRDVSYDIYLYELDTDPIVQLIVGKNQFLSEKDAPAVIKKALNEGKSAYFIGSFNSREDILNSWREEGITKEEEASVLLERYWFNIYKLGQ